MQSIPSQYLADMLGLILKENSFQFVGKNYLQVQASGGLYLEGRFNGGFFALPPSQRENGDLRKFKVCVNLRKVGHPTLRKLSTARKGL